MDGQKNRQDWPEDRAGGLIHLGTYSDQGQLRDLERRDMLRLEELVQLLGTMIKRAERGVTQYDADMGAVVSIYGQLMNHLYGDDGICRLINQSIQAKARHNKDRRHMERAASEVSLLRQQVEHLTDLLADASICESCGHPLQSTFDVVLPEETDELDAVERLNNTRGQSS
jgi:hypothetical protein